MCRRTYSNHGSVRVVNGNKCVSNWNHSVSNEKIAEILLALDLQILSNVLIPSRTDIEANGAENFVHPDLLSGTKLSSAATQIQN